MYFFNACVGVVLVVVLITNVSCDTCVPMTLPPDDSEFVFFVLFARFYFIFQIL